MQAILLVTVFSCLLGTSAGAGGVGEACLSGNTCTDPTLAVCESSFCKIKAGQTCATSSTNCVSQSTCSNGKCTCGTGYTTGPTGLCIADGAVGGACKEDGSCTASTSVCESSVCKVKAGQTCAAATDCVSQSTCSSDKCTCNSGYTATLTGLCNGGAPQSVSSWLLTGSLITLLVTLSLP